MEPPILLKDHAGKNGWDSAQWWKLAPRCAVRTTGGYFAYVNADDTDISTPLREAGILTYFKERNLFIEACHVEHGFFRFWPEQKDQFLRVLQEFIVTHDEELNRRRKRHVLKMWAGTWWYNDGPSSID